jgi:hypothetical protein
LTYIQLASRVRKFNWMFKSLRHVTLTKKSHDPSTNLLNQIYIALVQSILVYCIPVWGGALKTRFLDIERAQRSLLKIMYFKNQLFPTDTLYTISNLMSVRKLYILYSVLRIHKTLPHDPELCIQRRRKNVVCVPLTKTAFAEAQFQKRSADLYNKINKQIDLHSKTYSECKYDLMKWLNGLNYDETESLLQHTK